MAIEKFITLTVEVQISIFLSNLFNSLLKNSFKEFTAFLRDQTEEQCDMNDEGPRESKKKPKTYLRNFVFQNPQEYYSEV